MRVAFSCNLYEAYTRGYLSSAKDSLTETETEYMAFSSKLMTYECGIRFLGDYLNGDVYFKTDYPEHNLVRAKTQFALAIGPNLCEISEVIKNDYSSVDGGIVIDVKETASKEKAANADSTEKAVAMLACLV